MFIKGSTVSSFPFCVVSPQHVFSFMSKRTSCQSSSPPPPKTSPLTPLSKPHLSTGTHTDQWMGWKLFLHQIHTPHLGVWILYECSCLVFLSPCSKHIIFWMYKIWLVNKNQTQVSFIYIYFCVTFDFYFPSDRRKVLCPFRTSSWSLCWEEDTLGRYNLINQILF